MISCMMSMATGNSITLPSFQSKLETPTDVMAQMQDK